MSYLSFNYKEIMVLEINVKSVEGLIGSFLSSILHFLPLVYLIFIFYQCGSGSKKLLNTDPICIRIHITGLESITRLSSFLPVVRRFKAWLAMSV